ncbi:MAG: hypothetical protein ABWZ42_07435 [Ilumatobacteraceae bacterium]
MSDARATLRELRRTRTKHRLGSTDWWDVAYRVYLFAFAGLTLVVVVSDAIDGLIDDEVDIDQLFAKAPSILGIAVVLAVAMGLRSGADGGPISVEVADIRHVLLAPLSRRLVLVTPIWQRFRSMMFSFGLVGAIVGQLIATELPGSRAAWAASCAIYGAIIGALFVGAGVIAHAMRLPRWGATGIGAVLIAWQAAVAWAIWNDSATGLQRVAPANLAGNIALWGIDQRPLDALAIVFTVVVIAVGLALGGYLRLEPLARRGELVSQLRFAATSQDLRTVVLLRRQLRAEAPRNRSWIPMPTGHRPAPVRAGPVQAGRGPATHTVSAGVPHMHPTVVWRRGVRAIGRLPASRVGRILALSIGAGAFGSLTFTSSPLFSLLLLGCIFFVGLESIEALSQEVDRADITDSIPLDRGWIYANHLVAPAALLVIVGVVGALTATILDPDHAIAAFALMVPVAWGGALGPIVATVNDAPATASAADMTLMGTPRNTETSMVPPEFAGFSTVVSTLLPVVISCVGILPVVVMRLDPTASTGARASIAVAIATILTVMWVRSRDRWTAKIRNFFAEGRAAS